MSSYYFYGFFIIATILQFLISRFHKAFLLNIVPAVYVIIFLGYTLYTGTIFNNILMLIVLMLFGYAMLWRVGIAFFDARENRIKRELERMKTKDI